MKFFLILFLSTCLAQNNGFIINQIQIDGNEIISDDNIKFISGLEEGMYVNNFKIQNSIKRLWDTKRYEHIDIRFEESFLNNKIIIIVLIGSKYIKILSTAVEIKIEFMIFNELINICEVYFDFFKRVIIILFEPCAVK